MANSDDCVKMYLLAKQGTKLPHAKPWILIQEVFLSLYQSFYALFIGYPRKI